MQVAGENQKSKKKYIAPWVYKLQSNHQHQRTQFFFKLDVFPVNQPIEPTLSKHWMMAIMHSAVCKNCAIRESSQSVLMC